MTPLECGQLTKAHKHCGYSFFHSENGLPQGYCFCEVNYFEYLCPREENIFVTEYKILEWKAPYVCNQRIEFIIHTKVDHAKYIIGLLCSVVFWSSYILLRMLIHLQWSCVLLWFLLHMVWYIYIYIT